VASSPNDSARSGRLTRQEPRSFLGAVDDWWYIVERGIVTFALLAMALTYFLDILHVEMTSQDNAFVRLVYRFSGYDGFEQPPVSLRESARTWMAPLMVGTGTLLLAWFGVYTADRERKRWNGIVRLGMAVVLTALLYGFGKFVELAPSRFVCIGIYFVMLGTFAVIYARRGMIVPFTLAWVPMSALVLSILLNVNEGYSWAQDISKILIMWVGFVGASMATRDHKHIRIDFVRKLVPQGRLSQYNALSHLVTLAFCLMLLVLATWYLLDRFKMGAKLGAIDLPIWSLVLPVPLSLLVMVLRFSGRLVVAVRGGEGTMQAETH
jgi:TRAP-type C4-dicarboxylate transport system permease small subunit